MTWDQQTASTCRRLPDVHIDLTVVAQGAGRDVRVTAPAEAPLNEVLAAVAAAIGVPHSTTWAGHSSPCGRFGDGQLRSGSVLQAGHQSGLQLAAGVLCLQVTGGPAAGTSVALE